MAIESGGVRTLLYGGNANFYHIALSEYDQVLSFLEQEARVDTLVIPSAGPGYGMMMDQAKVLRRHKFPTVMILPQQGITTPPGNTAYNVTKAGVKVVTEALAHELRNIADCQVSAHLLIPGFTFTGFTRVRTSEKPPGAWLPEQVVDFLLPAMAKGDFYILCPDNDVTRGMDERRIRWAAEDIIENRPALSRWHPDFQEAFAAIRAFLAYMPANVYEKPPRVEPSDDPQRREEELLIPIEPAVQQLEAHRKSITAGSIGELAHMSRRSLMYYPKV